MVNHTSSLPLFKIMGHLDLCMGSLFAPDKGYSAITYKEGYIPQSSRLHRSSYFMLTNHPNIRTFLFSKIITNQIMLTLRVALELG